MASKKRIFLPILIIVGAIILAVLLSSMRQAPERGGDERLPVLVDYQRVTPQSQQFTVASQGTVKPKYDTSLVAEVSGQVVHLDSRFVVGGFFAAGDVLLQIDPSDYEVAREEARAALARAQAAVAEERAMGRVAEAEWRSIEAGEIPALGLRQPQLASALAELQSAEARLAQAERNLERTRIRAPFDGVLQSKQATLGQYISTNSVIGNLLGTGVAEVRLPLTDLDMAFVDIPDGLTHTDEGPEVELYATISGQRYQWYGRIVRTEGVVDSGSQVTYAVVEVQDPYNRQGETHDRVLNFGRFVSAQVKGLALDDLIELPRYAVNSNNLTWVITDNDPRTIERREVVVARRDRQRAYISDGLEAGEMVMLTQLDNPISGQRVRIQDDIDAQAEAEANEAADDERADAEQEAVQ